MISLRQFSLLKPPRIWHWLYAWALVAVHPLPAATFIGTNTGAIADNDINGRNVTFDVQNMANPIGKVKIKLTLSHSYMGDLKATLISPNGTARLVLFGQTGMVDNDFGDSDLNGVYTFSDDATGDWWAAQNSNDPNHLIPSGSYRTTTLGVAGTKHGGCSTSLEGAFGGLTPAQINGTWTLNIADLFIAPNGTITGAELTILDNQDSLFSDHFDGPPARGNCQKAQFDYHGTGRSSFVVVHNDGTSLNWRLSPNNGTAALTLQSVNWGTPLPAFPNTVPLAVGDDFDGDGIWDVAVWYPGNPGQFWVNRSSRPFMDLSTGGILPTGDAPLIVNFGQTGDNPYQLGDYDGDGRTDFAMYRSGATLADSPHLLIRPSSGGADRDIVLPGDSTGLPAGGVDYITGPGQFLPDGKAEIILRRDNGQGNGLITIFVPSLEVVALQPFVYGGATANNLLIHGNYAGSPAYDLNRVFFNNMTQKWDWETAVNQGGTQSLITSFGTLDDYIIAGDYDGDGIDDPAFWTPSPSTFTFRRSSKNDTFSVGFPVLGGANKPLANIRVYGTANAP